MRHLIAKRNRLRNMIAEQEGDRWLVYSDEELHEVLTDVNFALMKLEIDQHVDLWRMKTEQLDDETKQQMLGNINRFDVSLGHAQDATRHSLRQLAKPPGKKRIGNVDHAQRVHERCEDLKRKWDALTPQEQSFFGKPKAIFRNALDFPDEKHWPVMIAYPDRAPVQEGQLRKLKEELAWVEQELNDQEGAA